MTAIPCFIVEEHHEALIAWHSAVLAGALPPRGNVLVHVDEHADMGAPRLHRRLPPLETLASTRALVFEELSCFEFIVPAAYLGLFDEVHWVRQNMAQRTTHRFVIWTDRGERRTMKLADVERSGAPDAPDTRHLAFSVQNGAAPIAVRGPIVLDVDLDYFSCANADNRTERLEVTQAEYDSFRSDPYHFLRVNQGSRITAREERGRYFLYLKSYQEDAPTPLKVSEDEIVRRMAEFAAFVRDSGLRPAAMTIARSRLSGYTPADQWTFIEEQLVATLSSLFPLDVVQGSEAIAHV